ncbi:hypothetical protein DJ021_05040 [Phenylobacterium hankyongense]|uniref:Uncharacterized protein n=1 Tax=Phenylobacterium hankyongense TaxID=1813876 RepID=A0A328AVU9_9CAUL|nr:hypothetical protein [Phenylobacterium hankyongense]RAK59210.1 hypothetical protein DJ021_05040 [Phenylobacterium hankyongense]
MKTLKTLALIGASALALSATAASAQPYGRGYDRGYDHSQDRGYDRGYDRGQITSGYVDSLDWRISQAAQQRRISWQDARQLRGELRQVQPLAYRVQTGQARRWEQARLERTVHRIEVALSGGERYGYGYRH